MAEFEISLGRTKLHGLHNRENMMAAALAAACVEIDAGQFRRRLIRSAALPRVEWVRNWRGVDFYDDSKATNVGAVVKAMEGFDRPILLLLGGRDKLGAYRPLLSRSKHAGKGVFAFGEAGPRIYSELCGEVPAGFYPDLASAFRDAIDRASPGDVVLLSPACSSFDQYESYAHRGDHFKKWWLSLYKNSDE